MLTLPWLQEAVGLGMTSIGLCHLLLLSVMITLLIEALATLYPSQPHIIFSVLLSLLSFIIQLRSTHHKFSFFPYICHFVSLLLPISLNFLSLLWLVLAT